MSDAFLPKALNRTEHTPLCVDIQRGVLSTDIHWHDCAEIIHLQCGTAKLFSKDGWAELLEGETAFIPKGEPHCCHCTDKNALRIVIGITEDIIGGEGTRRENMLFPFSQGSTQRRIFKQTERLVKLFSLLNNEVNVTLSGELEQQLYVGMIYCEMLRTLEGEGIYEKSHPKSDAVKRIEHIIDERYTENLTAQNVARSINLSYSHMAKLLREECGMSFGELLLSRRIEAAKRLLLTTDMSVTDIGISLGFADASYFIKRFGERVGLTPYRYREDNLSVIY